MMKALTLTQPWASLVAIGAKRIETRSWRTAYRGLLAIHAAASFPADAKRMCDEPVFANALGASLGCQPDPRRLLPLGAVIATAQLLDCLPTNHLGELPGWLDASSLLHDGPHDVWISEHEAAFGNYELGRWAWLLGDIIPLPKPIPAKGALGLWEWNAGEQEVSA
jgi:hypothetical protein